jgi:hypothetical protein
MTLMARRFLARVLHADAVVEGFSNQLQQPIAFAAVDSIVRDQQGQLRFHYVVVEVRCGPDLDDDVCCRWFEVAQTARRLQYVAFGDVLPAGSLVDPLRSYTVHSRVQ